MSLPYQIIGTLVLALLCLVGGGLLGWHEKAIRVPTLLQAQQATDATACQKAQLVTQEENDALQKDRDAIASRLDALRLQHPATCVPVTHATVLSAGGLEHAGSDGEGLSSDWLRSYAAEAEQYRTEVSVCVDFLAKERQELGVPR